MSVMTPNASPIPMHVEFCDQFGNPSPLFQYGLWMNPNNVAEISQFSLDIRTNVSFLHIHT